MFKTFLAIYLMFPLLLSAYLALFCLKELSKKESENTSFFKKGKDYYTCLFFLLATFAIFLFLAAALLKLNL